jgi:hypothetical protein
MDTEVHPEPVNARFAYVSVSRASHDARVFTNDACNLLERLSSDVSKTSALNFVKEQASIPSPNSEQLQVGKKVFGAELGLAMLKSR